MNARLKTTCGACFLALLLAAPVSAQRYIQPVFSTATKAADVVYGAATNVRGVLENLAMDVYQPQGDTLSLRPLIVFVHGGGFVGGDKGTSQFVTLCQEFAKRGYVTASINYRLDTAMVSRAVMNAMHDARAAVRYFRKNAAQYRLDTARIAMGGGSAGAYTSLSVAYVDKISELPPLSGAGDVEGLSGNPGYSSRVRACLDYWGALLDTAAIETADDAPLLIIHGTEDNTVPFTHATMLRARATHLGLYHEFYPLQGEGHGPWGHMDSIVNTTARFLYRVFFGTTTSVGDVRAIPVDALLLSISPNPFTEHATFSFRIGEAACVDAGGGARSASRARVTLRVLDALGREVARPADGEYTPGTHTAGFDAHALPDGRYTALLRIGSRTVTRSILLLR
ncbi:MAG: alpha/beta hydrolase [Ignavibacteria bacterium]|nr:alpha/beta hydrolase [Ignavibacteria bacterium]